MGFTTLMLLLTGMFTYAQNSFEIKGRVTGADNQPLEGVSVRVKGAEAGTVTSKDGTYRLLAANGRITLVFGSVGYTVKEEAVNGRNTINAAFSVLTTETLDDVVVIGYQTVKRKNLLASVVSVGARDLKVAEKGIRYGLKAQYYSDSSSCRAKITYNDNAMVNVLNIMQDTVEKKNNFILVDASLVPLAAEAVAKGIICILKTQVIVNGKLTAWCAQYNHKTLQPEMARKFELVSLSGMESAGIVSFLLCMPNPTQEMKQAIQAAVEWFEMVKINGYVYKDIIDLAMLRGKEKVIVPAANAVLWARFYEIPNNRPFFTGRDSIRKYKGSEIEHERRIGYAWYGTWPGKILVKDYPA